MKRLLTLLLLTLLLLPNANAEKVLRGQDAWNAINGATVVRYKDFSHVPAYIKFHESYQMPFNDWQNWVLSNYFKGANEAGFELISNDPDKLGMVHYRYRQTWDGKEVESGMWLVHVRDGKVVSMNGELFAEFPDVNASLSESAALNIALDHVGATTYKWEIDAEEALLKSETGDLSSTYYPAGDITYVNSDAALQTIDLHLAWKFNVYAAEPLSRSEIYVDATNGSIVFEQDLIHHADSNGVAATGYSGNQNIVADYNGTNFTLEESGRGNGVMTYNMNNGTTYGAATNFIDNDNFWNPGNVDAYAGDAHWGSEMTYDYFFQNFNRNSINNNGFALRSYIHYGTNFGNAFWDGQRMTYGDGNNGNSPFTAIDIAGHEVTHGLTTFTAGLIYQNESGALNESFSDIFGAAVEFFALGFNNGDWLMGEDLGFVIRSMSNPNSYGDPDTYHGTNWEFTAFDNGGVHINSGVQNFWFYLLTVGGSGSNDLGNNYNVTGIGVDDAGAIAFRNLTVYLTQSSQYTDARFYALESAEDLFGVCSQQLISAGKAWYAVGVGNDYSTTVDADFSNSVPNECSVPHTVEFYDLSSNGSNYSWNFGDGGTSTQANPIHTYTAAGTYSVTLQVSSTCGNNSTTEIDLVEVGPNAPCNVVLPATGTISAQTGCIGILYDNGGPTSSYTDNTNSTVTIAPNNAGTITLDILEFDMQSGPNCIFDYLAVFDGSSTSAPLIGNFCNSNPPPAAIISSGGSITLQQISNGSIEEAGFKIAWTCNDPTTPPVADFEAADLETCDGVVIFQDFSSNAAISWAWDFGDGNSSTLQNPTHSYTQDGTYNVKLVATNIIGSDSIVKNNYIIVDLPDSPVGSDVEVCPGDIAQLTATGPGVQTWYNVPSGGIGLFEGDNFLVGIVNATTPYYVESVIQNSPTSVGAFDASIGPGVNFNNSGQYMIFDVYKSMTLESVKVFASGAGDRTIELRDVNGTVLQSLTVTMAGGEEVITLDFPIDPGSNYQLGIAAASAVNLYRNSSGAQYPYQLQGIMSITQSSANTNPFAYYYFFYDWQVSDNCISERVQINASVDDCLLGLDEISDASMQVFPNPNKGEFTIRWDGNAYETIELVNLAGQVVTTVSVNGQDQVTISETLPAGAYSIRAVGKNGIVQKQVLVQ